MVYGAALERTLQETKRSQAFPTGGESLKNNTSILRIFSDKKIFNDLGPSIQSQLEIRLYHPINVDYLFSIIVTTLIEVEIYF